MISLTRIAFLTPALLLAAEGVVAQSLDRLFYTPRERTTLDAQRNQSAAPGAEGDTVTVNGLVTRSSGKSTVWINGVPQNEGESGDVEVLGKQGAGGKVSLRPATQEKPVGLRVGQTLEGTTGKIREVYDLTPSSDEVEP
jgi:hypothetical protein